MSRTPYRPNSRRPSFVRLPPSTFILLESVSTAPHYPVIGLKIRTQATMTSSKETITAVVAEQLSSMSLGESGERKGNDETEPTTSNGTTPTKLLCSACEKKSDSLMKCRACKCVWYCDKDCQDKHWEEHKKECKRIKSILDQRGGKLVVGTEKDVGPLGKLPPREECPICMRVFPLDPALRTYANCCGNMICGGCIFQHQMTRGEQADTCAFCRAAAPGSDEEILALRRKRIELNDPKALYNMALNYDNGAYGLAVDQVKCIDLLRQSAAFGYPFSQYQLGMYHYHGMMGLEQNEEEALKLWEKAAEGGHLTSRNNLGAIAYGNGDRVATMRHWRLSAAGGFRGSMEGLIVNFEDGLLHHGDLAKTLQAMYRSRAEMKSEGRDQHIKHLKEIGEYQGEYDLHSN